MRMTEEAPAELLLLDVEHLGGGRSSFPRPGPWGIRASSSVFRCTTTSVSTAAAPNFHGARRTCEKSELALGFIHYALALAAILVMTSKPHNRWRHLHSGGSCAAPAPALFMPSIPFFIVDCTAWPASFARLNGLLWSVQYGAVYRGDG